ncbi:unnamed protein product [Blepharisma stoltei]|uniref:Amidase domain-containing protein n=1 Tax=Blepharisma stoltei TaxID=1481888 RepID=A0AAU9IHT7_9CILI|nr:unnamed protein product [Blepharisma stoltei]
MNFIETIRERLSKVDKRILYGVGVCASLFLYSRVKKQVVACRLRHKAKAKRAQRDAKKIEIPPVDKEKQEYILSLTALELAAAIKEKKFTCLEAVATYIGRAYDLGRKLELTAEEPFEEALDLAKAHDEMLLQNPENCGPLHGVPVSIKDHFSQIGCTSSSGCAWRLDLPDEVDCLLLELLKDAGAIPFIRSNVPQGMLWIESSNDIYGTAKNPWNKNHTTGGSSGGEAGLVACRASPLGLGSDIGGSIRIPSTFCGVYGLKPTPGRVSNIGVRAAHPGDIEPLAYLIGITSGPIGRCVDDLKAVMECFCVEKQYKRDLSLAPIPFNHNMYNEAAASKNLKIGYFYDLEQFESAPCIKNAIRECKEALEKLGHTLIEIKIPNSIQAVKLYKDGFNCHGNKVLREMLQGETPQYYYRIVEFLNDKYYLKPFFRLLLKLFNSPRVLRALELKDNATPAEYIDLFRAINSYKTTFSKYWNSLGLDAVICPAYATVAPPHTKTVEIFDALDYCMFWNVVEYPSGIVPVRLVEENETNFESEINDLFTRSAKKIMAVSAGMPIGIQIAGKPYHDEVVLGVMKQVEDIFKFHKHPY